MKVLAGIIIMLVVASANASCSSYKPSVPSPACPQNYLFSCQPNLVPVPCSAPAQAPAASYGSTGAYTEQMPTYAHLADYLHRMGYLNE